MSRISVVIPVYNVEAYLEDCLDSLAAQTLDDIEIICVNDGSTDASLEILVKHAREDARIRIIDKPNGGLSSARNAGMDAALSTYVCFLDSDDRFTPDTCGAIVGMLDAERADVLTFGAKPVPEDAAPAWMKRALTPGDAVYNGFAPELLFEEASRPFAWRTACRVDFLREKGIRFDESLRFGEDQVFHFAVYPRSAKTILSSKKLYEYRLDRPGSLMTSIQDSLYSKLNAHLAIVQRICADWDNGGLMGICPVELISFIVDFVAYDALKLPDDEYKAISSDLGRLISAFWTIGDLQDMPLKPQVRHIVLDACCENDMPRRARMMLAYRYFVELHGIWSVVLRVFRGRR